MTPVPTSLQTKSINDSKNLTIQKLFSLKDEYKFSY